MPPPPPPPPPGPPSAPRAPLAPSSGRGSLASSSRGGGGGGGGAPPERSALLSQIQQGKKLKSAKNLMNDRSAPIVAVEGKSAGGGSSRPSGGGPAGIGSALAGGLPKLNSAPSFSTMQKPPSKSAPAPPPVPGHSGGDHTSKTLPHPPAKGNSRFSSSEMSSKPFPVVPPASKATPPPPGKATTNGWGASNHQSSGASSAAPPPPSRTSTNGWNAPSKTVAPPPPVPQPASSKPWNQRASVSNLPPPVPPSKDSAPGFQSNQHRGSTSSAPAPPPPVPKSTNGWNKPNTHSTVEAPVKAAPFNPCKGIGRNSDDHVNNNIPTPNKPGKSFAGSAAPPPPPPGKNGIGAKPFGAKSQPPIMAFESKPTMPKSGGGFSAPPPPPPSTSFGAKPKPPPPSSGFSAPGKSLASANQRFPPPPPQFK